MSEHQASHPETTELPDPEAIIRETVRDVCSDGNSDSGAVARAVIGALYAGGYQILPAEVIPDV